MDLLELLQELSFWQGDILLGKESLIPVRIVCHKLTKEQSEGRRRKANALQNHVAINLRKETKAFLIG